MTTLLRSAGEGVSLFGIFEAYAAKVGMDVASLLLGAKYKPGLYCVIICLKVIGTNF